MKYNPIPVFFLGVFTAISASAAHADFTPPKDGKLTEKQVTAFIAISKSQIDTLKAASKAEVGSGSTSANLAISTQATEKINAAIKDNGLTKDEFNWIGEQVSKVLPTALLNQQWIDNGKPDLEKQIAAKQADLNIAKARLTTYEQAQKEGKRVMTKEQREAALASVMGDRDSVAAEVKTDQASIQPINEEIAAHEKEANDSEALANNPPAEINVDDRAGYVDGKKNQAQTARDAAKDSRERLKEAQKNLDDAKARLSATNKKMDHLQVPVSDDDKAAVRSENEQAITEIKTTIDGNTQAVALVKETLAAGPTKAAVNEKDKPDPDNLALVQNHIKEYLDAIGAGIMLKSK